MTDSFLGVGLLENSLTGAQFLLQIQLDLEPFEIALSRYLSIW
jgi:hypothetical protein